MLILMIRHHACRILEFHHTGYLCSTGDAAPNEQQAYGVRAVDTKGETCGGYGK
jgi:hypothetical protein